MRSIIKGSQRKISLWAGGSSSQICIWPPEADYAQRNFLYRISTAVAETDDWSDYTMLPGVCRHLLMLDGEAEVCHESGTVLMKPYEPVNVFDGGEKTIFFQDSHGSPVRYGNAHIFQKGRGIWQQDHRIKVL